MQVTRASERYPRFRERSPAPLLPLGNNLVKHISSKLSGKLRHNTPLAAGQLPVTHKKVSNAGKPPPALSTAGWMRRRRVIPLRRTCAELTRVGTPLYSAAADMNAQAGTMTMISAEV